MDPILPNCPNGGAISVEFVEQQAAIRSLPMGIDERRESDGRFASHRAVLQDDPARAHATEEVARFAGLPL